MSNTEFAKQHIIISGAGLGGLCLAQGLFKAGISFHVYERDHSSLFRAQGYRIRINHDGATALKECLPETLWQLFLDTCAILTPGMVGIDVETGAVKRGNGPDPRK